MEIFGLYSNVLDSEKNYLEVKFWEACAINSTSVIWKHDFEAFIKSCKTLRVVLWIY